MKSYTMITDNLKAALSYAKSPELYDGIVKRIEEAGDELGVGCDIWDFLAMDAGLMTPDDCNADLKQRGHQGSEQSPPAARCQPGRPVRGQAAGGRKPRAGRRGYL
jgi:hypothetical protein